MQIDFAWYRRDEVVNMVAKLERRAAKLGVDFTVTVSSVPTRAEDELIPCPLTFHLDGSMIKSGRVREWGTIDVVTPEIKYSGWTLVGVLTPMPVAEDSLETVLFPSAVPGQTLPEGVREWSFRCEHCGYERRRLETFVLRHEDGSYKQVGRQCIRDYLGHDADRLLARYDFITYVTGRLDEDEWGFGGGRMREPSTYRLEHLMEITSAVVRKFGWVSAKRAQAYGEAGGHMNSTKQLVTQYLFATGKDGDEFRREVGQPTDDDRADAEAARAFWSAQDGRSDYEQNAQMISRSGLVIARAMGLAVSLLPVYRMRMETAEIQKREAVESTHVGTVGKREVFEVEVVGTREFESDFGVKTLVTMRTREGALVKWWASGDYGFLPEERSGEFVAVAATVKAHGEYKGRKETTVSRVGLPPAKKGKK